MKVGDVVIATFGYMIDAIGIVDGPYEFDPENEFGYHHIRSVKWIAKNLQTDSEKFLRKNVSQQTIYRFSNADIKLDAFEELTAGSSGKPKNHVLIIDEINRGNVSSIFGELITLLEHDKRKGAENEIIVKLPYSKEPFSVPSNLYILGTMNTADRSVEALDAALRRRFSFVEMLPRYDLEGLQIDIAGVQLRKLLETINNRLEKLLDKDHCIGHAYLLSVKTTDDLKRAFRDKIIPLLQEYFFGDFGKIGLVLGSSFVKSDSNAFNGFASFNYSDDTLVDEFKNKTVYTIAPEDEWDFASIIVQG
jgi:5-methylcytosine-specific restriction endonuclease McrBC GTP-binding regulatory subunit McrB